MCKQQVAFHWPFLIIPVLRQVLHLTEMLSDKSDRDDRRNIFHCRQLPNPCYLQYKHSTMNGNPKLTGKRLSGPGRFCHISQGVCQVES